MVRRSTELPEVVRIGNVLLPKTEPKEKPKPTRLVRAGLALLPDSEPKGPFELVIPRRRWTLGALAKLHGEVQCYCALGWLGVAAGATAEGLHALGVHWGKHKPQSHWWRVVNGHLRLSRLITQVNDATVGEMRVLLDNVTLPADLTPKELMQIKEELLTRIYARLGIRLRFKGSSKLSPQLLSFELPDEKGGA